MTKIEMNSSANLINNLLLNLDNLKIQTESSNMDMNNGFTEDLGSSLQDQLELLKNETQKLTSQYTQPNNTSSNNSSNGNNKNKYKKIPPPIITGIYKTKKYQKRTQFQTIDDILFELNDTMRSYNSGSVMTPSSKSSRSRKMQGSFVDPRRYSDPYKYTILSTLDETVGDEEEEEESSFYVNTPKTPLTALPYYSRKKNYDFNKFAHDYYQPKSAGPLRNRSYSQPEKYISSSNVPETTPVVTSSSDEEEEKILRSSSIKSRSSSLSHSSITPKEKSSSKYLKDLQNTIHRENEQNSNKNHGYVKPPRSSSFNKHRTSITSISEEYSSGSEGSDEMISNRNENGMIKKKGSSLENKSSFQSDVTLVNE